MTGNESDAMNEPHEDGEEFTVTNAGLEAALRSAIDGVFGEAAAGLIAEAKKQMRRAEGANPTDGELIADAIDSHRASLTSAIERLTAAIENHEKGD